MYSFKDVIEKFPTAEVVGGVVKLMHGIEHVRLGFVDSQSGTFNLTDEGRKLMDGAVEEPAAPAAPEKPTKAAKGLAADLTAGLDDLTPPELG